MGCHVGCLGCHEGCLKGLGGAKVLRDLGCQVGVSWPRRGRTWVCGCHGSLCVEREASRHVAVGEGVWCGERGERGESKSRRGVWKTKVLAWESPSVALSSSSRGSRVGVRGLQGLGLALARPRLARGGVVGAEAP